MHLLRSQLNELYDLIEKQGYFSPLQFSVLPGQKELTLNDTQFYFRVFEDTGYANSMIANFSPGKSMYMDATSGIDWEGIKFYFKDWLSYLKREVSAPDKWERLIEEVRYLIGESPVENTAFSHQEYLEVRRNIDNIKNQLSSIPLLEAQNTAILQQLNRVAEMTDKLNKFDWRNFFIGTITSCVIQLGVTQEHARLLAELIRNTFSGWLLLK
ncbi:hypothetical protein [Arcticibacter tournemirensis]|uniref:Uncharacterized protein n=1 Tax=Arcticibacter tournemirensis TaxID=699437 RepID=A0A4Q0MCC4_9SPHI|nr:hypothetical protein [Arcticibacter tournemirensis]RXF70539.1 hypothetical protein EKH83_07805 [Arcticibacter tournemirensis]